VNNRWNLEELMQACRFYFKKTGRRISFEYIMINNLNDTTKQSNELAKLIKGYPTHVNLIPINSGSQTDFKPSTAKDIKTFKQNLEELGVNVTVRRTLGADINAACGQLKKKEVRR
ncbi:MAG: 23S rRNA (adenine(2503)-C(2))-methyltransferase RlmN, partial [Alphaproteobacteria bacterium]|nr:23S rRNA (adenine(2503)-C(2))-methyltransferase RlmN [Alphaproteobacteria bacterium]